MLAWSELDWCRKLVYLKTLEYCIYSNRSPIPTNRNCKRQQQINGRTRETYSKDKQQWIHHKFSSIQVITQIIIKAYIYFTITKTHETPTTMGKWHRYVQCQAGTPYFLVFVTLLKRTLFHTKSVSIPPHVVGGGWVKTDMCSFCAELPTPDTNTSPPYHCPRKLGTFSFIMDTSSNIFF